MVLSKGGAFSSPTSINNSNEVVGVSSDGNRILPFLWKNGNMLNLGELYNGMYSLSGATSINNMGQVVGSTAIDSSPYGRAFLWTSSNGMQNLGTLGGNYSSACSINDSGQMVGISSIDTSEANRAFLWTSSGGMKDLNNLVTNLPSNSIINNATSINNNGNIVGYFNGSGPYNSTYLISQKDGYVIQPLWQNGYAQSINDKDQVVGCATDNYKTYGILWDKVNGAQNLNSLTINLPSGTVLERPQDINNKGQIVGYTSDSHAFLLTPKSASKTYGLFIGIEQDNVASGLDLRADKAAKLVMDKFAALPNFAEAISLTGNMADGGVKKNDVESAINLIKGKLKPGDTFVFFVNSHGGSIKSEPTLGASEGRFLALGTNIVSRTISEDLANLFPNNILTDSDLHKMLDNMGSIQKLVLIDACYSGGFYNSINSLQNASLIASAEADKEAHTYVDYIGSRDLKGLFSYALSDAFSYDENGKVKADYDPDGIVTSDEILRYVKNWEKLKDYEGNFVYEEDLGDPTIFTLDKWTPVGFKTDDFIDGLPVNPVPIPSSILLLGSGLLGLGGLGFKRKFSTRYAGRADE